VVQAEVGEKCDDGNRLFGDGCNSVCEVEVIH
jgi:cysteine-rich repeat protein